MKNRPTGLTRRKMLFSSAAALGVTLLLPRKKSQAAGSSEPRFLLNLVGIGGLDASMMFDARPRAMTAAGKIHNPLNEDPMPWMGDNGQAAMTHTTAAPLHPLRDKFSVINGVLMSTNFDGHDQNLNLMLAGNPFGGVSFNAILNKSDFAPLDYVRVGDLFANLQDTRNVELTPAGLKELVGGVKSLDSMSPAVDEFLTNESGALGDPYDRFGAGVLSLDAATTASKVLSTRLQSINLGNEADPLDGQLALIRETFKLGIARGAMFSITPGGLDLIFDTHASTQAVAQGPNYVELSTRLARVFRFLSDTPYDGTRSLLDVTTVIYGAEFGRTMRQSFAPINNTGTDHNPLSNSLIVGGAGIKGGLVVGASDFQTATEQLSPVHLMADPESVKTMAKPFDFTTQMPRTDLPQEFKPSDYLQIGSVINTIYSLFGVEQNLWRRVEQGGSNAPVLTSLVK